MQHMGRGKQGKKQHVERRGDRHKGGGDDSECSNVAYCGPQHAALCACVPTALLAHGEFANTPHMAH